LLERDDFVVPVARRVGQLRARFYLLSQARRAGQPIEVAV
jgi:hypothetical protein